MPFQEWSDDFLTGNSRIDQHHKEWLGIINEFYDTLNMGNLHPNLIRLLDKAIAYADYHFKNEEGLMEKHNFQNHIHLKKEDDQLKEELMSFKKRLENDRLYISQPVTNAMKKWFYQHVTGHNINYTHPIAG